MMRMIAKLGACAALTLAAHGAFADEAVAPKSEKPAPATTPAMDPSLHPSLGVPIYEGAKEASKKDLAGLGLDAVDGYKVGAFFSNAAAIDVATWYIKALRHTVKKELGDGTLRYTIMVSVPSGENPLGEKVVVDQNDGGVKDETGATFKTLITVYRRASATGPMVPPLPKEEPAPEPKPEGEDDEEKKDAEDED